MSLDLRLKRVDRVYYPGDSLTGVVVVTSSGSMQHNGINLSLEGSIALQLSTKSVGLFEAFYSSMKPTTLMTYNIEVSPPGKLPGGTTELPFEFKLVGIEGQNLVETYHGVFINIQYMLTCDIQRPMLAKNLKKGLEFIMQVSDKEAKDLPVSPVPFTIVPSSLENVKKGSLNKIPQFRIVGRIDSANCSIVSPLTGEIIVEECGATIKSIELQLVRVETCGSSEGLAREATEIQNIQIADGDICRNVVIPIHMVFPRLFTCPSLATRNFKIEFEVNLVILLQDGHLITENFPIKLYRP
eukprot:GFYU01026717.1.p1 GENE.GFYU01026717.1~~GFYU01026717.1.p1  ORF type:complete len:299 (-),score=51.96 GFYU01026717.1:217-1113(-)